MKAISAFKVSDEDLLFKRQPEWMFRSSGVIPFRWKNGELQVLLVTTKRKKHWIIPKGIIEPGLSPEESACNEAWEEAGVKGALVGDQVGHYHTTRQDNVHQVEVFLFEVRKSNPDWPEKKIRRRLWLPYKDAATRVREPELINLIKRLPKLIMKAEGKP
jgi:8-oxo-dGTP pyrophosphatase MutT (NUDIX family)